MSTAFRLPARSLATLLAVTVIAACAAPGAPAGHRHGRDATRPQGGMMAGGTAADGNAAGMDMDRLCAMHRAMHEAPADQRQSIQERHMKGLSPEMRRQLMDQALRQCH